MEWVEPKRLANLRCGFQSQQSVMPNNVCRMYSVGKCEFIFPGPLVRPCTLS